MNPLEEWGDMIFENPLYLRDPNFSLITNLIHYTSGRFTIYNPFCM